MIDPGYIPEDLSQYLLNYCGNEEEHSSCNDYESNSTQILEINSSEYDSIFIPPYVSTPKDPHTMRYQDQENFQDSGRSEDESDSGLSLSDNRNMKDNGKVNSKFRQKSSDEKKQDKSKKTTTQKSKQKKEAQNSLQKSGKKSSSNSSKSKIITDMSVEVEQDVSSKATISKNNKKIENSVLDSTLKNTQDFKNNLPLNFGNEGSNKRPLSPGNVKDSSTSVATKKIKIPTKSQDDAYGKTSGKKERDKSSKIIEIFGDVSSDDESENLPQTSGNANESTSTSLGCINNSPLQNSTDDVLMSPRKSNTKKLNIDSTSTVQERLDKSPSQDNAKDTARDQNKLTIGNSRARRDVLDNDSLLTQNESKTESYISNSPKDIYESDSFVFEPKETPIHMQKSETVPLHTNNGSTNSSSSEGCGAYKLEPKKKKSKNDCTLSTEPNTNDSRTKKADFTSLRREKSLAQKSKSSSKKCITKIKITSNSKTNAATRKSEKEKLYRAKKKKYLEDLEQEVKELKSANESLKLNRKNVQNEKEYVDLDFKNLEYKVNQLEAEKKVLQNDSKEMSSFIQDLKDEVQQLHKENENLISLEDMESIVNDLKNDLIKLKKQKEDLQKKEKEKDLLVSGLEDELKQLKKVNERNKKSVEKGLKDKMTVLEKEKKELENKLKDKELMLQDFTNSTDSLTAEKKGFESSKEEMDLFVNNMKKVKTLIKSKGGIKNIVELDLIIKGYNKEICELKKQKVDHENKEKELISIKTSLEDEVKLLKNKKANCETKAKEMESFIAGLKGDVEKWKNEKADCECKLEEMESLINGLKGDVEKSKNEKADCECKLEEMESFITGLKGEVMSLKNEKANCESKAKEMESFITGLKGDVEKLKNEKADCECKLEEMESIIKILRNESSELRKEKENKERKIEENVCIMKDLKAKNGDLEKEKVECKRNADEMNSMIESLKNEIDNLKKDHKSIEKKMDSEIKHLKSENEYLKNIKNGLPRHSASTGSEDEDISGDIVHTSKNKDHASDFSNVGSKGELQKLCKESEEISGKMGSFLQNLKGEVDHLKQEKENSKKNTKKMFTVVESLKKDMDKLKSKENETSQDLKELQKDEKNCVTTKDMSYYMKDLKDEIGYLKGLIISQSQLSALVKHVGTFQGFESNQETREESSSGKRKLDSISDSDTPNNSKRPKPGNTVSTVKPAGVCLHVNNGNMSVEFCSTCSKNSSF